MTRYPKALFITASFDEVKKIQKYFEHFRVKFFSVCGNTPKWFLEFGGEKCKYLMPKKIWWDEWNELYGKTNKRETNESKLFYLKKYIWTVLSKFNLCDWYNLNNLDKTSDVVVFCCLEPDNKFCHRQFIKDFIQATYNWCDCFEFSEYYKKQYELATSKKEIHE